MSITKTSMRIGIALVAVALIASLAVLASQGRASDGATKHARRAASTTQHRQARSPARNAGANAFQVLARAPQAEDLDNAVLRGAAAHDPTLVVAGARLLQTDGQTKTWLIPTSVGKICLALQPGDKYTALETTRGLAHPLLNYVCISTAAAVAHGLALRTYSDIVGLVPDGVRSVQTQIGGVTSTAAVANNVFHARTQGAGFSGGQVSYGAADGSTVSTDLP